MIIFQKTDAQFGQQNAIFVNVNAKKSFQKKKGICQKVKDIKKKKEGINQKKQSFFFVKKIV